MFRGGSRFFLGGGALVSRSTSTPINHTVFFLQNTSCIRKPQVVLGGGAHPLYPPPRSAPDVTRDDLQRRFLAQCSVATLLRHCFEWLQHCPNIAKLCWAENRRCKSSLVTLSLARVDCRPIHSAYITSPILVILSSVA